VRREWLTHGLVVIEDTDLLADELREFFGADFDQALESRDYAPRTNLARSLRNISNGFMHLTPTPMHALGIFIFLVEAAATS